MPAKKKYTAAERAAYGRKMAAARAKASTRPISRVSGRGFYKGFSRQAGALAGSLVGAAYGAPTLGGAVGGYLGQKISDITGFGAYDISHLKRNTLVLPRNPRILNDANKEGAVVISHREHIGTVKSSTAFTLQYELSLNPAQQATFPWLSAIASNFTQYEMMGCIFQFVSTSGNAVSSTNNALGEVIMTSNANALDSSYVNKTQMLNSDFAQSFAPSVNGALPIECSPSQSTLSRLYTRYGAPRAGADLRMADLSKVTIATSGMQADDIEIGELYVVYQVALYKPQLVTELGFTDPAAHYQITGATNVQPFGTSVQLGVNAVDTIGLTFDVPTSKLIFPRNTSGKFIIKVAWSGSLATNLTAPNTVLTNCDPVLMFDNSTSSVQNGDTTGGNQNSKNYLDVAIEITDSSKEAIVDYAIMVGPASINMADIYVWRINYDLGM